MAIAGDRDDTIWLAGLLEGEGCFDLHKGRYPRIRLGMTDRDVVGRAAVLMGSRVRSTLRPAPFKSTWHTEVSGNRAALLMRSLLPHMGTRRSQRIADVLGTAGGAAVPGPTLTQPPGY